MADSRLVLHCGAREVTREELDTIGAPPPTETWFPTKHATVIETVKESLANAGFQIERARFGLSRNDMRMFSTFDLASPLASGVNLAVGVRNSIDKSFPLGLVAGQRVFVCDNLAFRSEISVAKKHTKFGQTRFEGAIVEAIKTLDVFREHESSRIKRLQGYELSDQEAESLMLRSFERRIVCHRILARVIGEWRKPSFDDFEQRDAWSLLNAYTTALGGRAKSNPQEHARVTMRLNGLIDGFVGIAPFALPAPAPADGEEANGHA